MDSEFDDCSFREIGLVFSKSVSLLQFVWVGDLGIPGEQAHDGTCTGNPCLTASTFNDDDPAHI